MAFIIVDNLRGFFNSRPPLVVFMICLASFAIALITFAYIVKTKDMPNPDISEDWNTFLKKFSELEFCVSQNLSVHNLSTSKTPVSRLSPSDAYQIVKKGKGVDNVDIIVPSANQMSKRFAPEIGAHETYRSISASTGKLEHVSLGEVTTPSESTPSPHGRDHIVNVTLRMNIQVSPSVELLALPLSTVHFTAALTGSILSPKGKNKEQALYVTFSFPSNLSESTCEEKTHQRCNLYVINTCVTFSGPASLLPHTQKPPESETCPGEADPLADSVFRNMTVATPSVIKHWCAQGARMTANYFFDDSLTVMLTEQDRSAINLHLMRTSYFLFVMVVTLFCYAMIKGRPAKVKTVHIPYEKVSSQA